MKKPSYLLKIENPCGEDWAQMKPDAQGRFCSHCSKTVVNFAELTDNQILKIIEREEGRVCGRFHNDQLNRPMAETKQQNAGGAVQKILAAMLAVSAANYVAAQTPETKTEVVDSVGRVNENKMDFTITMGKPLVKEPLASKNVIEGQVIEYQSKDPIPFATITIKGTKRYTVADKDGRFMLRIPDRLLATHNTLIISSKDYEILEASFYQKKYELFEKTEERHAILGGLTIISNDSTTIKKKANCTDNIHL